MRYCLPIVVAVLLSTCKRPSAAAPMLMHVVATSYYSDAPYSGWQSIANPGSVVVSITSGRATGQLLHVKGGKAIPLQTFEFDAASHSLLCSTAAVSDEGEVDVGFVQESDVMDSRNKSQELKLGKVSRISRVPGHNSISEKANILYRIQRTGEPQDRWRPAHEESFDAMIEASKALDCEYIVLDVHARP
ncbi:MAG: hypothetical protein QM755_17870 [Luteolibacter sp.]